MSVNPKPGGTERFLNSPKIKECLQKLNEKFGEGKPPLVVSDVLDQDNNQYVNLVQKGGGVLGVALIGYTYILESMGIRFMRMAGTSAGAINTAMLAIIGNKNEAKSERVLKEVNDLNFFSLVDGHPFARWLIRNFISRPNFAKKAKNVITGMAILTILLIIANFIFLWVLQNNPGMLAFTKAVFIFSMIFIMIVIAAVMYFKKLLLKLKNSGYGINPGDTFYDWIKAQMISNGVHTVDDLVNKASQPIPGLHLREDHEEGVKGLKGDVTFIATELVTQNKIEFPAMCGLFREEGKQDLQPAGFVRASMSIPFFFESWFIENIPCNSPAIIKKWQDTFNEDDPPSMARFVDGGILSNFPISIFYNSKIAVPRLPSFGIDLDDSFATNKIKRAQDWTLRGYFGRIFNAIRNYYDKDFQIKNRVYSKGIGTVYLPEFNWLNFFLTEEQKLAMFEKGAQAATQFLLHFNWEAYKKDRAFMQEQLEKS